MPFPSHNVGNAFVKMLLYRKGFSDNRHDELLFPAVTRLLTYAIPLSPDQQTDNMLKRHNMYAKSLELDVSQGLRQFVSVGVGLDTKLLRYTEDPALADAKYFDLDLPHVAKIRRCVLARLGDATSQRIGVLDGNLSHATVHDMLAADDRFNRSQPTSYIEEAVFMYIDRERRLELVRDILENSACGSRYHFLLLCNSALNLCVTPFPFLGEHDLQRKLDAFGAGRYRGWLSGFVFQRFDFLATYLAKGGAGWAADVSQMQYFPHNQTVLSMAGMLSIEKTCGGKAEIDSSATCSSSGVCAQA
jgi:hypothetical protein